MSFAKDVKEEIATRMPQMRHCKVAELSAIISFLGKLVVDKDRGTILQLHTDSNKLAEKVRWLFEKVLKTTDGAEISEIKNGSKTNYCITLSDESKVNSIMRICRLVETEYGFDVEPDVFKESCCLRSFLRGAYLGAGAMSDPKKSYHFEIVCDGEGKQNILGRAFEDIGVTTRYLQRKGKNVCYVKEGRAIADILVAMNAYVSMMELENIHIHKSLESKANRAVNCDIANTKKTLASSKKQCDDIRLIEEKMGLDKLPEALAQMARARMEYSWASLTELGDVLDPKVSKSGVCHRLKKLSEIADSLRSN